MKAAATTASKAHTNIITEWNLDAEQERNLRLLVGMFININEAHSLADEARQRAEALDNSLAALASAMGFSHEQVAHAWTVDLEPVAA